VVAVAGGSNADGEVARWGQAPRPGCGGVVGCCRRAFRAFAMTWTCCRRKRPCLHAHRTVVIVIIVVLFAIGGSMFPGVAARRRHPEGRPG
jgi:hypothetical protein